MADNLRGIPFSSGDEGNDIPFLIKEIVFDWAKNGLGETLELGDVYVVWFAYVLGNWKGLASTTIPDGRYYEVTYNSNTGVGYVDTYRKTHNHEFDFNRKN